MELGLALQQCQIPPKRPSKEINPSTNSISTTTPLSHPTPEPPPRHTNERTSERTRSRSEHWNWRSRLPQHNQPTTPYTQHITSTPLPLPLHVHFLLPAFRSFSLQRRRYQNLSSYRGSTLTNTKVNLINLPRYFFYTLSQLYIRRSVKKERGLGLFKEIVMIQ